VGVAGSAVGTTGRSVKAWQEVVIGHREPSLVGVIGKRVVLCREDATVISDDPLVVRRPEGAAKARGVFARPSRTSERDRDVAVGRVGGEADLPWPRSARPRASREMSRRAAHMCAAQRDRTGAREGRGRGARRSGSDRVERPGAGYTSELVFATGPELEFRAGNEVPDR